MRTSDVFRPRLPIDPFSVLDDPPPWRIHSEPHPGLSHIILLLGTPSHADIAPLANSKNLTYSLLIIATHIPPPIPPSIHHSNGPSIIILRLAAPLDVHDSGALRLVSLLERAQRVAQSWKINAIQRPRLQQFAELYPGGDFSMAEEPELAAVSSDPPHNSRRITSDKFSASSSSLSSVTSRLSSSAPKSSTKSNIAKPLFSAILNFLPPALPEKALLKGTILVTTISTPFLATPYAPSPYQTKKAAGQRLSFFSTLSLSSLPNDNTPRPRKRISSFFSPSAYARHSHSSPPSLSSRSPSSESLALPNDIKLRPHLVHVLPYSAQPSLTSRSTLPPNLPPFQYQKWVSSGRHKDKSKLVESLEQFMLSFAYPLSTSVSSPALVHHAPHQAQSSPSPLPSLPSLSISSVTPTGARVPQRSSPLASNADGVNSLGFKHTNPPGSNHHRRKVSTPFSPEGHNKQRQSYYNSSSHLANANAPVQIVPFILPAGVLGAQPSEQQTNAGTTRKGTTSCIGELLLLGMLDDIATGHVRDRDNGRRSSANMGVGSFDEVQQQQGWPRAWIGGSAEVEIVGSSSSSVPPPFATDRNRVQEERKEERLVSRGAELERKENDIIQVRKRSSSSGDTKVRRNEAGLPTPPGSTSSLDGESDDDDDDGDYGDECGQNRVVEKQKNPTVLQKQQRRHMSGIGSDFHPRSLKPAPFLSLSSPSQKQRPQVRKYHYERQSSYHGKSMIPSLSDVAALPPPDERGQRQSTVLLGKTKTKQGFKMRFQRLLGVGSGKAGER